MSKVIDITSRLTNERPRIKISEDFELEVNVSKNNVIKMQTIMNDDKSEIELIDEALKVLIGKHAYDKLNKMDLTVADYKTVFIAVMACINNESFEDADKRFRNETK